MPLNQISGMVLILGSLIFIAASAMPPHIYQESDIQKRLTMVANQRESFLLSNVIFGISAIITAVGLGLFALAVQDSVVPIATLLGTVSYSIAALLLCWYLYVRAKDIAAYFNKTLPGWIMPLYIVLMTVSLTAFGIMLLQAGYPGWIGIGIIVFSVIFFAGYLRYNDTIPQIYYLLVFIAGMVIFWQG